MRNEKGFTLIEIVMVIVLLGILAAVAIPRYIDLQNDARDAALRGVVGSMSGAMSVNYAARSINVLNGSAVTNCTDINTILMGGTPTGYIVTPAAIAAGATANCVVTPTTPGSLPSLTFVGIGIL